MLGSMSRAAANVVPEGDRVAEAIGMLLLSNSRHQAITSFQEVGPILRKAWSYGALRTAAELRRSNAISRAVGELCKKIEALSSAWPKAMLRAAMGLILRS